MEKLAPETEEEKEAKKVWEQQKAKKQIKNTGAKRGRAEAATPPPPAPEEQPALPVNRALFATPASTVIVDPWGSQSPSPTDNLPAHPFHLSVSENPALPLAAPKAQREQTPQQGAPAQRHYINLCASNTPAATELRGSAVFPSASPFPMAPPNPRNPTTASERDFGFVPPARPLRVRGASVAGKEFEVDEGFTKLFLHMMEKTAQEAAKQLPASNRQCAFCKDRWSAVAAGEAEGQQEPKTIHGHYDRQCPFVRVNLVNLKVEAVTEDEQCLRAAFVKEQIAKWGPRGLEGVLQKKDDHSIYFSARVLPDAAALNVRFGRELEFAIGIYQYNQECQEVVLGAIKSVENELRKLSEHKASLRETLGYLQMSQARLVLNRPVPQAPAGANEVHEISDEDEIPQEAAQGGQAPEEEDADQV